MKRDPWKLVLDEQELAPGMCVELRPCAVCGRKERLLLTRQFKATPTAYNHELAVVVNSSSKYAWEAAGECEKRSAKGQYGCAIRERRLYRLIDDDAAADETTTTRRKERVR